MGIMDVFNKEDGVDVTFSTFYSILRECAKAELLINAVNCDVPNKYIREMITGTKEDFKVDVDSLLADNPWEDDGK